MDKKETRQKKIMEIIRKDDVGTQEELSDRLKEAGFSVTQATVSRDIRELKLTKMPMKSGRQKYAVLRQGEEDRKPDSEARYSHMLQGAFSCIEAAQNILVIKTAPGMAMAAAAALDGMKIPEIVGCIAGDDTIFAAVHTAAEAQKLAEKMRNMIS
ncbi:MAG: arginine repressor [Lachnospiraceae bacterium]|jgi:transcriptional regulator of arginine metabolism|nr:arginine repressor [Lachnospiraceae bacterium]